MDGLPRQHLLKYFLAYVKWSLSTHEILLPSPGYTSSRYIQQYRFPVRQYLPQLVLCLWWTLPGLVLGWFWVHWYGYFPICMPHNTERRFLPLYVF